MSNKVKTLTKCEDCKNHFKVSFGSKKSICPNCIANRKQTIQQKSQILKNSIEEYSQDIEFKFDKPDQKIQAVKAQGEAFASKGGVDLMITEFVENSFDAIKTRKVVETLPKAIKQMNFNSTMENVAIEKYTLPVVEFKEKYPSLTSEDNENLNNLHQKIFEIIKSENQRREYVVVELDDVQQEVRIIDSGTGIEHPIHICEQPFVSLKTGQDFSTGKFGRGSQVFREFCNTMEYYSLREKISKREEENIIVKKIDTTKFNTKSIYIEFPALYPGGKYGFKDPSIFKKLSNYSRIGTVVILSKWNENYYDDISKHISKLETRLEHHFGFALNDIFNIGLKIKTKKNEINITSINFEELSKETSISKIDKKFELPTIALKDHLGNPCGEVEFHIYKTVRNYHHEFKEPFLIVNGRPLGDTALHEMPGLSQHSEIWKSNTITGHVICNSVEPNALRIGLSDNKSKKPFSDAMTSASIELKKLNTSWKKEISSAIDHEIMSEVVDTVTRFLSKKGIKFNFKNPLQKGIQKDTNNTGDEITDERVSDNPTGSENGVIEANEGEEVQIGYRKTKTKKRDGKWDENTIIVPNGSMKKDGNTPTTVKVKRSLVSKGGRKIRKSYTGPDLDFDSDPDCDNELSYFESEPPTVMIQAEHEAWKTLSKKAREQSNAEKFEKLKKNYLLERYLWEIMNSKDVQSKEEMNDENRKNMFWTYYHDLIDTR